MFNVKEKIKEGKERKKRHKKGEGEGGGEFSFIKVLMDALYT